MRVRTFTEKNQVGILEGGWSVPGVLDGLFQVVVVGPEFQMILGVPKRGSGGPVEILAMSAGDADAAIATLGKAMPDLLDAISRHGEIGGGVRPHRNTERLTASPVTMARAIRLLADVLLPPG